MPEQNPATEPKRVQAIWYGGEMSANAKLGLRELAERFPGSQRRLWVMPRQPGPLGTVQGNELMEGYRSEAEQYGFEVVHARENLEELASGLDESKYTEQTVQDIFRMEMSNNSPISAKDLTAYLLGAGGTTLTVDLSHHHMRDEEWEAVKNHGEFSNEAVKPVEFDSAELKVIDLSHGQDATMRHVLQTDLMATSAEHDDAGIGAQMMPHLDVFAMYSREGTKGQEAMKGAAEAYLSFYAKLAQDAGKEGNITFDPKSTDKEFKPDTITLNDKDLLSVKFNAQDGYRNELTGRMAISALTDGVYAAYGKPVVPDGSSTHAMPEMQIDQETWNKITMQTFEVDGAQVVPQIGLVKNFQNSWRVQQSDADALDFGRHLSGDKITLVPASNMGVQHAAQLEGTGLDKPGHLPYYVQHSSSTDNSPRRTPSPTQQNPDLNQLQADVAALNIGQPDYTATEGTLVNATANHVPQPASMNRSNSDSSVVKK
ncbi:hypothetical protein OK074_2729 [Actinobacteria bacterium OK074]|nr:hypothetical protein OK074_2729 [Actinobacteria bacterium OK074]